MHRILQNAKRGVHFQEYVVLMLCLISWFALDRVHYERWLSSTHMIHHFFAMYPSLYKECCDEYVVAH